jgi:hypothetical protein
MSDLPDKAEWIAGYIERARDDDYIICMMDCARVIEDEIAAGATQTLIAKTYALAMFSAAHHAWEADWPRVNRAIINRWSMAGLERVKKLAHKSFNPPKGTP